MFFEYDVAKAERQRIVGKMLTNRLLVQEATKERTAKAEAARQRVVCSLRIAVHESLPAKVANLVAQPCVPCCAA